MTTATRVLHPGESVRVPSRSVAGVSYTVVLALDGRLICNCPASYNHLECWHQKFVREEMTTETAVAIRPVHLQPSVAALPSRDEMSLIQQAAAMAFSGAVALPKELNTPQKVAAVMLYGWELGLKPMTALAKLYIVNGRVAPSAEVMAGLVMRAEPDIRLIIEHLDETKCTMRIQRPSRHLSETYTVTWDEIKKAGLDRNPMNVAYPKDRLRYHCLKRLLRMFTPDLINGMGEPAFDGMPITREVEPTMDFSDLYNEGEEILPAELFPEHAARLAAPDVDPETGEIPNDPKPETPIAPTADQLARIEALLKDIGDSWGKKSPEWEAMNHDAIERFGAAKLADRKKLSYDEANALILYLRRKNGEPVDMPLEDEIPATAEG